MWCHTPWPNTHPSACCLIPCGWDKIICLHVRGCCTTMDRNKPLQITQLPQQLTPKANDYHADVSRELMQRVMQDGIWGTPRSRPLLPYHITHAYFELSVSIVLWRVTGLWSNPHRKLSEVGTCNSSITTGNRTNPSLAKLSPRNTKRGTSS